jgi:hypothetical protein
MTRRVRWGFLALVVALAVLFAGQALAAPPPWAHAAKPTTTTAVGATTTTRRPPKSTTTTAATTTTTLPATTTTEPPTTTTSSTTTTTTAPTTTTLPPPSFPQGIWTSGSASGLTDPELATIKSLGYDFVQANPDLSVLDRVQAAGLKAAIWLGNYRDHNDPAPNCVWNTDDATLTSQVNLVKGHPAVAYWFIADEPHVTDRNGGPGCPTSPQQVADRNALIKSLDSNPDHKTLITENQYEDYAALANTTDILGLVAYPCNLNNIANDCSPSTTIADHINAAVAAGVAHYWSMPQIDGDSYYRVATPTALQTAIYDRWRTLGTAAWTGSLTFLWDGCSSCDGLANHPELNSTVTAENTGH